MKSTRKKKAEMLSVKADVVKAAAELVLKAEHAEMTKEDITVMLHDMYEELEETGSIDTERK